jgi:SAM-dependent methyltransferase
MTTRNEWEAQVGRTWAENYRLTDRAFSGLTQRLLERIAERAGHGVLDVGCGAGELALAVARARPGARIVGVDVSPELVAAAQQRGAGLGNASFVLADAGAWRDPGFAPDVVISRHGVMFFDDPAAAFANLHDQASEDAELVFSCFRGLEENPWASDLARLLELPPMPSHTAPGPFAFADPQHVEDSLCGGGWHGVGFEAANFAYIAGMGEDPVEDAMQLFRRIGPAAPALRALEGEALTRAEGWIRDWLAEHRSGDLVAFPAAAWIVTAGH